jgi:Zn-dependent peptidase ImmA (M78 family)
MSNVATARQKFQRAFAAALLCPEEGLVEFLGTTEPTDSDIAAAARHFHVNEKTVRSVLVNKHLMERRRLGQPLNDPLDASRVDELADAA